MHQNNDGAPKQPDGRCFVFKAMSAIFIFIVAFLTLPRNTPDRPAAQVPPPATRSIQRKELDSSVSVTAETKSLTLNKL